MRSETPFLCSLNLDPIGVRPTTPSNGIAYRDVEPTQRGNGYAVEVCWVAADAVICRTYQVRASNESCATRIACQRARKALDGTTTRIQAVDIERIERGGRHE